VGQAFVAAGFRVASRFFGLRFRCFFASMGLRRPGANYSRFNHIVADCIAHKSRCGRDLELTHDRCSVGLNRLQANVEQLRYRLAFVALGD
jgi:hypothetical protein